jgi:hypothetical protein
VTGVSNAHVEDHIRIALEGVVSAELGSAARVTSISRERNRYSTASPADIVTLGLQDGRTLRVFAKRPVADPAGNPDKADRERELLVYQHLLAGRGLPAPMFHGSHWNASCGSGELFLEYIDDWNLEYHCLEHWITAATRLAGLHAHFASRQGELARSAFLLRLDRQYYSEWASRALEVVTRRSDQLGRTLERPLRSYGETIDLIAGQPLTLVHNDLAPKNVIADTSTSPPRIYFVDWEMAGVGCGLLDLVHLAHGFGEDEQRSLLSSYCRGLGGRELLPEGRELRRLLSACSLHNTLYRLAHLEAWELDDEVAEAWVYDVLRFQGEV